MPIGTQIAKLSLLIDELVDGVQADLATGDAKDQEIRLIRDEIEGAIQKLVELRQMLTR